MSQPVSALAAGVQSGDGSRATAKVTINTRVTAPGGPIGLLSDVMQFPGPTIIGNWMMGATRVMVMGVPVINQASTGIGYTSVPASTGPLTVVQGETRVTAI